ncbi:MAG: EthD domain-containing protein [Planctomycetota bacterium]|nr:EthD domain-containing protein [Planctomycetota bacterium]
MIKFVMCLHRHPDMTREQFQDYWKNSHAPLFNSFVETHGAKRYVQDHTIDTPMNDMLRESRGMVEAFDGIAEVWFESEQAFIDAMSSEEGQKLGAILHDDESKFIDHARSTAFLATEHEV